MTVTVSDTDPRSVKALDILATSDRWTRGHRKSDGAAFFVIPSSSGSALYWTTTRECTCPDATQRGVTCKHQIAVRLWLARQKAQQSQHRARSCESCGVKLPPTQVYPSTCDDCSDLAAPLRVTA